VEVDSKLNESTYGYKFNTLRVFIRYKKNPTDRMGRFL